MRDGKTHYRKAFHSPYLSSADITGNTILTVRRVMLEVDATNKTKDFFNTAYFIEKEIRHGEPLKPMILNVGNSKIMKRLSGSPFIEDWNNISVMVYVDNSVKFGRDTVEGLRISPEPPRSAEKRWLETDNTKAWSNAKAAFARDGNLDAVKERFNISEENEYLIKKDCFEVE